MSGTNHSFIPSYVDSLIKEMDRYVDFFSADPINTIYFGGGTPSLLPPDYIYKIFDAISKHWNIDNVSEVTFECNPENITPDFLKALKITPINRLSIGVQSLIDNELQWLGRTHNAQSAKNAVLMAQDAGFNNISCDLIFALPIQTIASLYFSLKELISLDIQHISVYSLMFEEGSKISKLLQKGALSPLDENIAAEMYQVVTNVLKNNGFCHYEISNYAKQGYQSQHNSGYWHGVRYLGLGASAHSYDGESRFFNIPHTIKYCNAIQQGLPVATTEKLTEKENFNEYVFTALRTSEGLNINSLSARFGTDKVKYILNIARKYISNNTMSLSIHPSSSFTNNYYLHLTESGVYISDYIISDFMLVD